MQGKLPGKRPRPVHKDSRFVVISGYCTKFLLFAFLGLVVVVSLGSILEATAVSDFLIGVIGPLLGKLMGTAVIGIGLMAFLEGMLH